ncbi:hypothetical protein ABK905_17815 [Acerihabitans sp. KWT182]|uniref:Glycosyltransferase n=1 Tax=Acerihabitans sp. KWT182 TaxID=3157919 RepID=A0AAU7Q656_9GAMM
MLKLAMLVVLYDKEMVQSKTLTALINYNIENIYLTIINNGPNSIDEENHIFEFLKVQTASIKLYNYLENKPLSKIYNQFITENFNADGFVFFDDDSLPQASYIRSLTSNCHNSDIMIPRIISTENNNLYYPIEKNNIINTDGYLDAHVTMSISSGLVIYKEFARKMIEIFGSVFDERFALYGVDTSFFLRVMRISRANGKVKIYCAGVINHSLSRTEGEISKFRLKERLYDIAITARFYPEYVSFFVFLKKIVKLLLSAKINLAYLLVYYYIYGKHPRCE